MGLKGRKTGKPKAGRRKLAPKHRDRGTAAKPSAAKRKPRSASAKDDTKPEIRGWPTRELQCEEALRGMVKCIRTNTKRGRICFEADFMAVFERS